MGPAGLKLKCIFFPNSDSTELLNFLTVSRNSSDIGRYSQSSSMIQHILSLLSLKNIFKSKYKTKSDDIPEDQTGEQERQKPKCLTETSHVLTFTAMSSPTALLLTCRKQKTFREKATTLRERKPKTELLKTNRLYLES